MVTRATALSLRVAGLGSALFMSVLAPPAEAARDLGERTPLDLGPAPDPAQAASTGGGSGLGRMLLGLVIVVAAIYGLYWVMRRFKLGAQPRVQGRALRQLAALPLAPGRSLHLVQVGRQVVLVASAERCVTALARFDEREAAAQGFPPLGDEGESASAPAFASGRSLAAELVERLRRMTVRG